MHRQSLTRRNELETTKDDSRQHDTSSRFERGRAGFCILDRRFYECMSVDSLADVRYDMMLEWVGSNRDYSDCRRFDVDVGGMYSVASWWSEWGRACVFGREDSPHSLWICESLDLSLSIPPSVFECDGPAPHGQPSHPRPRRPIFSIPIEESPASQPFSQPKMPP